MTGKKLAELALGVLPLGWGYIYGTAGVLWTEAKQAEIEKTTDKNRESARKYGSKWIGHTVADCSGLVKYLCKQLGVSVPHGSNSMWDGSVYEKGTITGKDIPVGALVFKVRNGSDFYHVGIYVGKNRVVEAKGTQQGVVESKLSEWSHYGLLKTLGYEQTKPVTVNPPSQLQPGWAMVDVPNDGTVNIRKAATMNSTNLGTLREGECCEVTAIHGDWAAVEYTARGYIMTKFLRNVEG